jgi:uncharacterized membrane protein
MSNQPNTNKEELLKSIKTALRGVSLIFYLAIAWLPVFIGSLLIGVITGGVGLLGIIIYLVVDAFMTVYGAYLLRRGIKGIGGYYNNQALIEGATEQFILWLLMLILPVIISPFVPSSVPGNPGVVISLIVLIPLGLKMSNISGALYNLTGIKDFDSAKSSWKVAAYLAIILIGGLVALFALYSTRKGFKEMINQVSQ